MFAIFWASSIVVGGTGISLSLPKHTRVKRTVLAYLGRCVAMNFRISTWTKMWKAKIRGTVFQVRSDYRKLCLV